MVGVGGRSKGCVNCRKNKKGCDLERPECGRCRTRGIKCEGYEPDRIFVYQQTRSKRNAGRLPRATNPSFRNVSSSSILPAGDQRPSLVPHGSLQGSVTLPTSLCRSAYNEKGIEAFLGMYKPQGDLQGTDLAGQYLLRTLPVLSIRDEALRLATIAIGTVTLGKQAQDTVVIEQGRRLYNNALVETRRALQDPIRARSAAILTIPHILSLYEILFGADRDGNQAASWLSHAEGEVALILARGPEAFIEKDSHEIFCNARYRPIIAAVRTRTPSPLNDQAWKTIPWRDRNKTPNDELLDILVQIPAILQRVDKDGIIDSQDTGVRTHDLETVAMCRGLHSELETWVLAHHAKVYTPSTDVPEPIDDFKDLAVACLTIRYWVTALLLYSSLDTALQVLPEDASISHPDRPHPRLFARRISRAAAYFFQEGFGITGATSLSFPLGNALLYFRRNPQLDAEYLNLIMQAWGNPNMPEAIKHFLISMRKTITIRPRVLPAWDRV